MDPNGPLPSSEPEEHGEQLGPFVTRHVGPSPAEQAEMCKVLGVASLDELVEQCLPPSLPRAGRLSLPEPLDEPGVASALRELASENEPRTTLVGMGYAASRTPAVIRRHVLENPAWYTAYTPYQAEISQGRLEALLNFQTMVADLTGCEIANASLLDEATAVAEGLALAHRVSTVDLAARDAVVVDERCHPQTIEVVRTRALGQGWEVIVGDPSDEGALARSVAVAIQHPATDGELRDLASLCALAEEHGVVSVVATDLLACALLEPPGHLGADIVVGSAQRLGVPLWFGGPHPGFLATRAAWQRQLPGRLVGVSVDAEGRRALRLSLQTREQHIRRERATSNICTAQSLLAMVAGFTACYLGAEGIAALASRIASLATSLADGLLAGGVDVVHRRFFDTVTASVPGRADDVVAKAAEDGLDLRRLDADRVVVALDECSDEQTVASVLRAFGVVAGVSGVGGRARGDLGISASDRRTSPFLTHPVFSEHRSETAMARYLATLADKDLALDRTMIPLGSCTMKLNAAAELEPLSWPELADVHPFVPLEHARGYRRLLADLEGWLAEITGYAAVSLQPNAGSQGELAALGAIRRWHASRGQPERDVCLIPTSAHGTNAASARLAGFSVVPVACGAGGEVDQADLAAKLAANEGRVGVIMLTYPSTHGVFEEGVLGIADAVHAAGGQVFIDGANLNALVGLVRLADLGGDASHLNLHKTFCVPHGGGGPGVGPVGVAEHLVPFLPGSGLRPELCGGRTSGAVSGAPGGSPGVLPVTWAYLRLMGADGLRRATEVALLAANYLAERLEPYFPILYRGRNGRVAHECILDLRPIQRRTGIGAEDVAKRLADYGFHAPTMAFPVAGTLMVEPTESEPKAELDRFVEAMAQIRAEIAEVERGRWTAEESPLRRAPHTAWALTAETWDRPYGRREAGFPLGEPRGGKYWPPVARIDNAWGDTHLFCSCPPIEEPLADR